MSRNSYGALNCRTKKKSLDLIMFNDFSPPAAAALFYLLFFSVKKEGEGCFIFGAVKIRVFHSLFFAVKKAFLKPPNSCRESY